MRIFLGRNKFVIVFFDKEIRSAVAVLHENAGERGKMKRIENKACPELVLFGL